MIKRITIVKFLKFKLLSNVTSKFRAETAGAKLWLSIGFETKQSSLPRCFCAPLIRNTCLVAFNFIAVSHPVEYIMEIIPELA